MRVAIALENDLDYALELHGRAGLTRTERDVSFCLRFIEGRLSVPLGRVDWRPSKPHVNRYGTQQQRGLIFEGTHRHRLQSNTLLSLNELIARDLPIADDLAPDPATFNDLLNRVGAEFGIVDMNRVRPPEWSERLV